MDYETIDYLDDLTPDQMNEARDLVFIPYDNPEIADFYAEVSGSEPYALLHAIYEFDAKSGEVLDFLSSSFFDPFLLRIYDDKGNTITANDEADDGEYGQDFIGNWVAPYTGSYYVNASWDQGEYYRFYFLGVFKSELEPDFPLEMGEPARSLFSSGMIAQIGGNTNVFGTSGAETLVINDRPAEIQLDPSFNKGGDRVYLPGDSDDYTAKIVGSSAIVTNGEITVTLPVGAIATQLVFDDGACDLFIDTAAKQVMLGDLSLSSDAQTVEAGFFDGPSRDELDAEGAGRLLLSQGSSNTIDGDFAVFGTRGSETLVFLGGEVALDPSFNRGGDTIYFSGRIEEYEASLAGSTAVIEGGEGEIRLPVGVGSTTLVFLDVEVQTAIDDGLYIGSTLIGPDAVALSG